MMINWNGKLCAPLLEKLVGLVWVEDGEWCCADDLMAQAVIDAFTIEMARAAVGAQINDHARALRDKAVAGISPGEMASWPIKMSEAAKYAATGSASDAPMLSVEAAARGVTLDEITHRVSSNAAKLAMLEATISGTDGKHRDALAAITDFAQIDAYDWRTGWPEV